LERGQHISNIYTYIYNFDTDVLLLRRTQVIDAYKYIYIYIFVFQRCATLSAILTRKANIRTLSAELKDEPI